MSDSANTRPDLGRPVAVADWLIGLAVSAEEGHEALVQADAVIALVDAEKSALQARLAAAEAEAARASGLLQRWFDDDESYEAYRALVDETLAHLASRPEGEVRDGRV